MSILELLIHNEFTIQDSFNFAKEETTYGSSLYMASLDVQYLFTNIPLNETINNFVSDLHNKNLYNGKLSKIDLFKVLEKATSKPSFIFHDLLYKQVDGVSMGYPLASTLANGFHYEKSIMEKDGWIIGQSTLHL